MPTLEAHDGEIGEEVALPVDECGAVEDRCDRRDERRVEREQGEDRDAREAARPAERRAPRRVVAGRHGLAHDAPAREDARDVEFAFEDGHFGVGAGAARAQRALGERLGDEHDCRDRGDDERKQHVDDEGGSALRVEQALDGEERGDGAADDLRGATHHTVEDLRPASLEDWRWRSVEGTCSTEGKGEQLHRGAADDGRQQNTHCRARRASE